MPTRTPTKSKVKKRKRTSNKKASSENKTDAWREEDRANLEALEFIQAIDRFKRRAQKAFPSWSEVLEILRSLGYRKVDK